MADSPPPRPPALYFSTSEIKVREGAFKLGTPKHVTVVSDIAYSSRLKGSVIAIARLAVNERNQPARCSTLTAWAFSVLQIREGRKGRRCMEASIKAETERSR